MPIHRPGERHRYHNILSKRKGKRDVTATLSLTAMVDMFTVLVIFLLQNYNSTGEVLYIPKEVVLPKAAQIKELKPAHVVTISNKEVLVEKDKVVSFEEVYAQEEWMIPSLYERMKEDLEKSRVEEEGKLQQQIKTAVNSNTEEGVKWNKVTIQADKSVDFYTLKKVMYTVTEAGAGEINFAVMKLATDKNAQ